MFGELGGGHGCIYSHDKSLFFTGLLFWSPGVFTSLCDKQISDHTAGHNGHAHCWYSKAPANFSDEPPDLLGFDSSAPIPDRRGRCLAVKTHRSKEHFAFTLCTVGHISCLFHWPRGMIHFDDIYIFYGFSRYTLASLSACSGMRWEKILLLLLWLLHYTCFFAIGYVIIKLAMLHISDDIGIFHLGLILS